MTVADTSGAAARGVDASVRKPNALLRNLPAKIASIPLVLTALGVFMGGTLWTIVYSFTKSGMLPKLDFVGLDNYERLWADETWVRAIGNLAIFGVLSLVFTMVIGFVLAALLDQKIRGEDVFRTIYLYPFALSFIVTGLVWQWILNPEFGVQMILNNIPISLAWWADFGRLWDSIFPWFDDGPWPRHFSELKFDPLYDASIVLYGILIAGLWQGTGLVMCIMLAGIRGIDQEIWKAARVDGIGTVKTYIFIVIPMMRPVFITALVLVTSGIIKVYDLVVAQTSGGPGGASEMPAMYVYKYMFGGQNLGLGFAASTMMLVMVAIIVIPWAYLEFGGKKRG